MAGQGNQAVLPTKSNNWCCRNELSSKSGTSDPKVPEGVLPVMGAFTETGTCRKRSELFNLL